MAINKIGIIGAGQMGSGIAQVCATSGLAVRIQDIQDAALQKAVAAIDKNLERAVSKGKPTAQAKHAALALLATSTNMADSADCDLVIEAASEREDIKRQIFTQLTPHLKPTAILASNTSSISITRLGAASDRP